MAIKKPLVMGSNGLPQQLQSADSIVVGGTQMNTITQTNGEAAGIVIGAPVYQFAAGSVKKAQANAAGTADILGLVADVTISNGASGTICTDGVLTATTGQWDAIAGTTGGLIFGTKYFLSPTTAGLLTSTVPTTAGQLVVFVGTALSTTDLQVSIEPEILL